jgi:TolB-like protein
MSASPDIFLSYNREDQAVARRFADAFTAQGFNVWWDVTLRSGEAYDQVTEKALREAKAVVVLWSKKSVVSRWVRAEATLADRNKTLVPVMIEACERPIMFELTQTAELGHWQGEASDKAWLSFLNDVRRFVDKASTPHSPGSTPTQPSTPTITPDMQPGERGDAPSLAVLPFTNRSGLPEDEVFAIGMVEDVIDALSRGVYVRVVSSAATARFRTSAVPDLSAMATQLGVRYLLEGNVRRVGVNLRVTAQLTDASSGSILWTQKFERPLSELATLQEELVVEVAAHLDMQVHRVEMERALKKPKELSAWEAVMRAMSAQRTLNVANMVIWVNEASKAVAIAPDYGLAHAVLACGHALKYLATSDDNADEVSCIRTHAERALVLEPSNALVLAQASLAFSYLGNPAEGLRHGERAVRLNAIGALQLWYRL